MKKLILLFVAVLSFATINAQENKTQAPDASERATIMTDKMVKVLALSPEQKAKVQAVNLESVKLMHLNQQSNGNKPNELEVERQRITQKWDADISTALGADKLTAWKKHQADEKSAK